ERRDYPPRRSRAGHARARVPRPHRPTAPRMTRIAADARAFIAAARTHLRQQRRYPTYFLGLLFWPVLLPSAWVLMGRAYSGNDPGALAAFAARAGSENVTVFVFVGYAMYMWLSSLLWGPGTILRQEQVRGTLEAVFLTPASRIVQLVRGVFVLACGITFPVAMLPIWAQVGAWILPPTYIVDDIRRVLLRGAGLGELWPNLLTVVLIAAVTAMLAVLVFRYLEASARRSGMLGRF